MNNPQQQRADEWLRRVVGGNSAAQRAAEVERAVLAPTQREDEALPSRQGDATAEGLMGKTPGPQAGKR